MTHIERFLHAAFSFYIPYVDDAAILFQLNEFQTGFFRNFHRAESPCAVFSGGLTGYLFCSGFI
jgi:hypothetical protein